MLLIDGDNVTEANEVQYLKTPCPMLLIDGGSVTEANEARL